MTPSEQKSRAMTYRDAAAEHIVAARELYDSEWYVLACYVAGLSVECILRGYRLMIDPEFDSRHDIHSLYKLARFDDFVPAQQVEVVTAALGDVVALWSNEHRFFSEEGLRKAWVKRKLYEGVKGNFVKERTRQLVNAAAQLVSMGVVRWTHSFPS